MFAATAPIVIVAFYKPDHSHSGIYTNTPLAFALQTLINDLTEIQQQSCHASLQILCKNWNTRGCGCES